MVVGTLALVYTALTVSASANTQSDTLNAILLFYGEQLRGEVRLALMRGRRSDPRRLGSITLFAREVLHSVQEPPSKSMIL